MNSPSQKIKKENLFYFIANFITPSYIPNWENAGEAHSDKEYHIYN